ncbi:MAG: cytidylate kinase [Spirochaetes bacterium GWB1_48_6]|nr:MAG: cytidylate kinase [Spirochaetes bacterium GWB1_48_6]
MSNNQFQEEVKIAISGRSGCGNTTVSELLAKTLGVQMVNYTFRSLAKEELMDFAEICAQAETDPKWDYLVDHRQVEMANKHPSVLGSRLAIWLWKEARLKVYLDAPLEVRAQRISGRETAEVEKVLKETLERDTRDTGRYKKLYNIDNTDFGFADLIIDTSLHSPQEIVQIILEEWKKRN